MSTAFKQVKNNAKSFVEFDALNNTTSPSTFSVDTDTGDNFSQPGNGFYVTVWDSSVYSDPGDDPKMRIGLCTDRADDSFVVTWGQFGTPVTAVTGSPRIAQLDVARYIEELQEAINGLENSRQYKTATTVGSSYADYLTDGTADNVQLNAAILAVHNASALLTTHIVEVVTPLTLANEITPYPDVILKFRGQATEISIASNFAAGVAFREQSGAADNLTILNLTLNLAGKANVGGVHIYQGDSVYLKNLHVKNQGYTSGSKWAVRVGNYTADFEGTASHGTILDNLRITDCNCGTYEQLLFVNQHDARITNPYFSGNTNSNAYELMLYINNKNVVVEGPHFELPNAHSIGIQESDGINIDNITGNYDSNFKPFTIINSQKVIIDGVQVKNTVVSPTTTVINFFDRLNGPDGFNQVVDDTNNVTVKNVFADGWKYFASLELVGTVQGTDYTQNQNNFIFDTVTLSNMGTDAFQFGADNSGNNLHDFDFRNIKLSSWSGTTVGAFQLRGYSSDVGQMYGFRFFKCKVVPSGGGGANAAIRNIGMTVEEVKDCDFTGTFASYGALSAVTGGVYQYIDNVKGTNILYTTKTSNYTTTPIDELVNCTSGTFTVTLISASGVPNRKRYTVKNSGSGIITVATTSSQTIDGVTTLLLYPNESITVESNLSLSNWLVTDIVQNPDIHATVNTTNATQTTIATIAIPASTTVMIEARIVARRTGGSSGTAEDAAAYIVTALYKNVAGTATEVGETSVFSAEDQAGWDFTITPSSGNALLRVTGAANNNISWRATYKLYTVS